MGVGSVLKSVLGKPVIVQQYIVMHQGRSGIGINGSSIGGDQENES